MLESRADIDGAVAVPHVAVGSARTRMREIGDAAEYSSGEASLGCGILLVKKAVPDRVANLSAQ
jgi:hypothetical protein